MHLSVAVEEAVGMVGAGYFVEICLGIQYTGTCSMIRALIFGTSSKICPNPVLPFTLGCLLVCRAGLCCKPYGPISDYSACAAV